MTCLLQKIRYLSHLASSIMPIKRQPKKHKEKETREKEHNRAMSTDRPSSSETEMPP